METWAVYRRGYNTANNPLRCGGPEVVRVALVEAETEEEAVDAALQAGVTCYHNQAIWAQPEQVAQRRTVELL